MSESLAGKVVIVTGGASGMGEAEAHTFARHGATVVIADRDRENTERVAAAIRDQGGVVDPVVMDLRDEAEVQEMVAGTIARHGRIDVLDNNAAALELTAEDAPLGDLTARVLHETLLGNLMTVFHASKAVLPVMVEQGGGSIINIASVSGMRGEMSLTAYGISKAGVIQLTRAVATQYGKSGVRCNAVCPAYVSTAKNEVLAPPHLVDMYRRHMAAGDVVPPQRIADMVLFLATDAAEYINGQVICVDGGLDAVSPIAADQREAVM